MEHILEQGKTLHSFALGCAVNDPTHPTVEEISEDSPRIPSLKLRVMTMRWPWAASTLPSYGFPEFHSYDSPCTYTTVGRVGESKSAATNRKDEAR